MKAVVAVTALALVSGCAAPPGSTRVPTMPMREALRIARDEGAQMDPDHRGPPGGLPAGRSPGSPVPLLASPDIRMAYLYEWIDAGGNRHFGGWVAVALGGFTWVLDDGTLAPAQTPSTDR